MATLHYHDGRVKPVTNLGWLLRHWKDVTGFRVTAIPGEPFGAHLFVTLHHPTLSRPASYQTPFASHAVLWDFLNRPVFSGLTVAWGDVSRILSSRNPDAWTRPAIPFPG